jgi:hypothetical protein
MKKILIFLLLIPLIQGATPKIIFQKTIDKDTLLLGEPVVVYLILENKGDIPIKDIRIIDTMDMPGIQEYQQNISELPPKSSIRLEYSRVIPKKEGNYTLPPAKLEYYDPEIGRTIEIETESLKFSVISAIYNATGNVSTKYSVVSDVRNESEEKVLYQKVVTEKKTKIDFVAFSILGVGFLGFIGLVAYAYSRRNRLKSTLPKTPQEDDNIKEKLIEAKTLYYSDEDPVKAFSIISDELRNLIKNKFSIKGTLTNKEYINLLKNKKINEDVTSKVKYILDFCDQVKFARLTPSGEEFYDVVYQFEEVRRYLISL